MAAKRDFARGVEAGVAGRQIDHQAGFVIETNGHRHSASGSLDVQLAGQDAHVLIAASREVHHQYFMRWKSGSDAQGLGHGVRALERGQDAFGARQLDDRIERGGVVLRNIFGAAGVVQRGVFRADGGVVKPADTEWVSAIWPSSSCST